MREYYIRIATYGELRPHIVIITDHSDYTRIYSVQSIEFYKAKQVE